MVLYLSREANETRETGDEMKSQTWTLGILKVVVEAGRVTHSDTPHCVVGAKPNLDFLRRAGWRKAKATTHTDVWGRKIS
jgi:hypothetical protein